MYGAQLVEMAQVAEQEHMLDNVMARTSAQARRELRRRLGPGKGLARLVGLLGTS